MPDHLPALRVSWSTLRALLSIYFVIAYCIRVSVNALHVYCPQNEQFYLSRADAQGQVKQVNGWIGRRTANHFLARRQSVTELKSREHSYLWSHWSSCNSADAKQRCHRRTLGEPSFHAFTQDLMHTLKSYVLNWSPGLEVCLFLPSNPSIRHTSTCARPYLQARP